MSGQGYVGLGCNFFARLLYMVVSAAAGEGTVGEQLSGRDGGPGRHYDLRQPAYSNSKGDNRQ